MKLLRAALNCTGICKAVWPVGVNGGAKSHAMHAQAAAFLATSSRVLWVDVTFATIRTQGGTFGQVTEGLTPVEAELLAARRGSLDSALTAGFTTVNWLSLTVHQFVKACNQARSQLALGSAVMSGTAARSSPGRVIPTCGAT